MEPHEVLLEAKDGRAALGVVAADALEDSRAVMQAVGADVDPGVRPVHELPVHPDLLGLLHSAPFLAILLVHSDIELLGLGDAHELRRGQPGHVPLRSRADPERPAAEQALVDQHPLDCP